MEPNVNNKMNKRVMIFFLMLLSLVIWKKALEGLGGIDQKQVFFQGPVRYCLKYGKVYATSEHLEGIAAWVPDEFADMMVWRAIRSGSMSAEMQMGRKNIVEMVRFGLDMKPAFGMEILMK